MATPEERKHHRIVANKSNAKLKNMVFSHYCGGRVKCRECCVDDLVLLTIDHIGNDGNKHRKEIAYTGMDFYRWLKANNYPDGFQVLCWNCQFRKRYGYFEETRRQTPAMRGKAKYVQNLKLRCLSHYGSICSCGEADVIVLTLDHVNNDGAKHRFKTKTMSGYGFYLMLQREGYPNDPPLQVLCANCQIKKTKVEV